MSRTVGVVLAGGRSSRFGSPKAFAKLNGRTFYEHSMEALRPHCDELVIVTRPELQELFPAGLNVTTDVAQFADLGPLAGLLSAMDREQADRYIVLPCDMPFMDSKVIANLLAVHEGDLTAVIADGKFHPLVSIWDASVEQSIRESLVEGKRRVLTVMERHAVKWVEAAALTDEADRVFRNVNTPAELERR